jgi:hypothetical protein
MITPFSRNQGVSVNTARRRARAHAVADTLVGPAQCPAPPDDHLSKDTP